MTTKYAIVPVSINHDLLEDNGSQDVTLRELLKPANRPEMLFGREVSKYPKIYWGGCWVPDLTDMVLENNYVSDLVNHILDGREFNPILLNTTSGRIIVDGYMKICALAYVGAIGSWPEITPDTTLSSFCLTMKGRYNHYKRQHAIHSIVDSMINVRIGKVDAK